MKILLVDDHLLLAEALASAVAERMPQLRVQCATSLADAQAQLDAQTALVLLDLGLPDASGVEAVSRLREQAPQVRIVVMSANDRADTVRAAIEQGASGFVPKTADFRQLMQALRFTLEGGVALPAALLAQDVGAAAADGDDALATLPLDEQLTPRQCDVLRLLMLGQSNKLICRALGLSESSVKTHLEAVYRRLGVNSRTQAVVAAARQGFRLPLQLGDDPTGS
ncbi:response regulator transcription factor [Pelomonas sp. CA6]|uniref:response regulator n=1 Tax=Pelomonas sp. CA6 TaxID=2907999 RepID=UPI001F4C00FA|nr:response regulator transcription factor [Pelomonas sp. CA6]MCH7345686.1 response regulator transcription factor [Pelomonas sp. CA6]